MISMMAINSVRIFVSPRLDLPMMNPIHSRWPSDHKVQVVVVLSSHE